jgi:hypothetical protein
MRSRYAPALIAVTVLGFCAHTGCGGNSGFGDDGGTEAGDDVTTDSLLGESGGCSSNSDCMGGVCIKSTGKCCSDAAHVCGGDCCTGSDVCLFDQCVTPGAPCHSNTDCGAGHYCEPALGDHGDGGGGLEAGCTQIPIDGRCLPIPPTCPGDGGAPPDGGNCIQACEYHPSGNGMLNPVQKWAWGPTAQSHPNQTDVWSTPTVGRIYDTNCDGKIDEADSPVIVFISGNVGPTCCGCNGAPVSTCEDGIIRMVNGSNGQEIWTLDKASAGSVGFMGSTPALGDVDNDGFGDIVAMTGEGYVVLIDRTGKVTRTSDKPYPHATALGAGQGTGWGGGLAIADMNVDGFPEISFGDTVWTSTGGGITRSWVGGQGTGGGQAEETSAISDMDLAANGHLELLAGNTCYKDDGTVLWHDAALPDGFPGVGDFDKDGKPEAVLVGGGQVWLLRGADGTVELGPVMLPGTGAGGAPTVADFDGDGFPEIGVAQRDRYSVIKPDYKKGVINVMWSVPNHDFSSAVTGSTVFDFEGDGIAEVVYADECWLWVYDGPTGNVRLAYSHSSFTGTEAAMLADIDGDGHAEMLIPSNGVDMSAAGWDCAPYQASMKLNGQNWKPGTQPNLSYRGLVALGDSADSWVGTRTLWSEHTYHVTNICDNTDNACPGPNVYGSIPKGETKNWTVSYLNDFRQNVQDKGIFNAPDPVVALAVDCTNPVVAHVEVRNIGAAGLPTGIDVGVFVTPGDVQVGKVTTTYGLLPGQTQALDVTLMAPATMQSTFYAKILVDPMNPKFHSCHTNDEQSGNVTPKCTQ